MGLKEALPPTHTHPELQPATPRGPLSVGELFDFLQARGALKAQIIRTTGVGRLDASLTPQSTGNLILLIEIDPRSGHIV